VYAKQKHEKANYKGKYSGRNKKTVKAATITSGK
jgi:hypothetical protein